jgi:MFS family permease
VPLRRLFTPRVVTSVTNYCLLAFLDIFLAALLPLFYASPIHHGGLGLAPPTIGLFLAIFGILNGVLQAGFVPRIVERLGTKKTFLIGVTCFIPVYLLFPVLNLVAMRYGMSPIVVSLVLVQLVVIVISNMVRFLHFDALPKVELSLRQAWSTSALPFTVATNT